MQAATGYKIRKESKGRRPKFHEDPAVDKVQAMVMALAGEVAVMHDRLDTIERIADKKGVVLNAEIESFEPDQAVLAAREAWRQEFLTRVLYVFRKEMDEYKTGDTDERFKAALNEIGSAE
jgi:hypothetical protein